MTKQSEFVRFMRHVEISPRLGGCWNWKLHKYNGYGHFPVGDKHHIAHRWIYLFLGFQIPEGQILRHRCDNPSCVNPDHLEPGTHKDNMQDMIDRGRHSGRVGVNNVKAKIDEEAVRQIRGLSDGGVEHKEIAEKFGLCVSQIARISRREQWKHVQ